MLAFLREARWLDTPRARAYVLILAGIQSLGLIGLALTSTQGADRNGQPLGTDFISFWTAARLALAGAPASAYDPAIHHAAEQVFFGGAFGWYAFFYPPVFLVFCLPLGALPYFAALFAWLAATGYAYFRALRLVAAEKIGALPILAFPGVFCTIGHGQNALLSTALFAAGAAFLGARPWLAGALFGGLCYKPQLALVIPFGLAVTGRWRALLAMAATAPALAGLSFLLFGEGPWRAFLAEAPLARATLEQGLVEPEKMQSVFAAVRLFGGGVALAYAAQLLSAGAACLILILVLRKTTDALAQGAAFAAAALLVTPFLLDYDLTLMALPMAFLMAKAFSSEVDTGSREDPKGRVSEYALKQKSWAQTTSFLPYEKLVLLTAYAFPLFARPLAQHAHLPLGPAVVTLLFAAVARRILTKKTV